MRPAVLQGGLEAQFVGDQLFRVVGLVQVEQVGVEVETSRFGALGNRAVHHDVVTPLVGERAAGVERGVGFVALDLVGPVVQRGFAHGAQVARRRRYPGAGLPGSERDTGVEHPGLLIRIGRHQVGGVLRGEIDIHFFLLVTGRQVQVPLLGKLPVKAAVETAHLGGAFLAQGQGARYRGIGELEFRRRCGPGYIHPGAGQQVAGSGGAAVAAGYRLVRPLPVLLVELFLVVLGADQPLHVVAGVEYELEVLEEHIPVELIVVLEVQGVGLTHPGKGKPGQRQGLHRCGRTLLVEIVIVVAGVVNEGGIGHQQVVRGRLPFQQVAEQGHVVTQAADAFR